MLPTALPLVLSLSTSLAAAPMPLASVRVAQPEASADADSVERALDHFQRGIDFFEEGDFKSALFEFETAYAIAPNYRILYNIGVTRVETHDYAGARTSYRQYIELGGDEISADRRKTVEKQLEKLRDRVGVISVESTPPNATVWIGDKVVGKTPMEMPINIGPTAVRVELDGYQSTSREVSITARNTTVLSLQLKKELPKPKEGEVQLDPVKLRRSNRLLTGTWITLGIGGATGIGAVVTGVLALQSNRELEDMLATPTTPDELQPLRDRTNTLMVTTDVLIGVAAVAGVTAIGLGVAAAITKRRARQPVDARIQVHPGGFQVHF